MLIEVVVDAVALDEKNEEPVLLLKESEGSRVIPVWIGPLEAASILYVMEGVEPPRPFTHDLLKAVIEELGGKALKVDIDSLEDGVFCSSLHLSTGDGELRIVDARPSDGVALALRMGLPIFASEELFMEGVGIQLPADIKEHDEETIREYLESLDPKDFGKYKM